MYGASQIVVTFKNKIKVYIFIDKKRYRHKETYNKPIDEGS